MLLDRVVVNDNTREDGFLAFDFVSADHGGSEDRSFARITGIRLTDGYTGTDEHAATYKADLGVQEVV